MFSSAQTFRRTAAIAAASVGLAVGLVASSTNYAAAVSAPVITPSGPLTDQAIVQVDLGGLIPDNAYTVSICNGNFRGELPDCDNNPNYSRSFYTSEPSATVRFAVRKEFTTRPGTTPIVCEGSTGSICYMVIRQHGNEREATAETRVRFIS